MRKSVLTRLESRMRYVNLGMKQSDREDRFDEICNKFMAELITTRPKSEEEKDAIAFALQQLELKDIEGVYRTLEPFCTELPPISRIVVVLPLFGLVIFPILNFFAPFIVTGSCVFGGIVASIIIFACLVPYSELSDTGM